MCTAQAVGSHRTPWRPSKLAQVTAESSPCSVCGRKPCCSGFAVMMQVWRQQQLCCKDRIKNQSLETELNTQQNMLKEDSSYRHYGLTIFNTTSQISMWISISVCSNRMGTFHSRSCSTQTASVLISLCMHTLELP